MDAEKTDVARGSDRNSPTAESGELDLDRIADGLDQHVRTRAAARIIAHFSELRHEIDVQGAKVAEQGETIARLQARLAAVEKKPEAESEPRTEKKRERPKRFLFRNL